MINDVSKKKQLALIHAQAAKAQLDKDTYCDILVVNTGVSSAAKFTEQKQFTQVIKVLNKILESQGKIPFSQKKNLDSSFKNAVLARASTILGDNYTLRLDGIVKNKIGKTSLADCSEYELRRVMGVLSGIKRGAHA